MELYLYTPMYFHGIVLNQLSTGTTPPFFKFNFDLYSFIYVLTYIVLYFLIAQLIDMLWIEEPEFSSW
jgi:hypothetical protein